MCKKLIINSFIMTKYSKDKTGDVTLSHREAFLLYIEFDENKQETEAKQI